MLSELHDLLVKERNAQLQRMRHAHLVGLEEDISRQPHIHIQILALGQVTEVLHAVVYRRAQLERIGALGIIGLHNIVDFVAAVDERLAGEPLLRHLCCLQQEVAAFEIRLVLDELAQAATDATRNDAFESGKGGNVFVIRVTGKQLVRAFA